MRPSLLDLLNQATHGLAEVSDSPRFDAELLLAHALGITRSALLTRLRTCAEVPDFSGLVERRKRHEPVAYILGEWEFFSLPMHVQAPILVPRPETEHLVEAVLEEVGERPARVLDLCTGSGCVAVAIAHAAPACRVVATDVNPHAVDLARRNAERNGVTTHLSFHVGDLYDALPVEEPPFDVICANPPYVEDSAWDTLAEDIRAFEDPQALLAGSDGLDVIRRLARDAQRHLRPGGLLAFELGMGQDDAARAILKDYAYRDIRSRPDLAGIPRIVTCRRSL